MSLPALLVLTSAAYPVADDCHTQSNVEQQDTSVMFTEPCMASLEFDTSVIPSPYEAKETKIDYSLYWESWLTDTGSEPMISQSYLSNYFGVGVWLPSELEQENRTMTAREWIENHGLQFSLGFGDLNSGQPRMRFDYRWHEHYQGDVMMNVELPF